MDPAEKSLQMRFASHTSWAKTADRSARTENARKARQARFIEQAREMHPEATDEQIEQVANSLKKAAYSDMARRSVQARRAKREAAEEAEQRRIDAALAADAPEPAASVAGDDAA